MTRKRNPKDKLVRISLDKLEEWVDLLKDNKKGTVIKELRTVSDDALREKRPHKIRELSDFEAQILEYVFENADTYKAMGRGRNVAYNKAKIIKNFIDGLSYYAIGRLVGYEDFGNIWRVIDTYNREGLLKACGIVNPFIKKEPLDATPEAVEAFRKKHNLTQKEFCELYGITINEFKKITKLNQKLKGDNRGRKPSIQNDGSKKGD